MEQEFNKFSGARLKQLREDAGMSELELAFKCGLKSTSHVKAWEDQKFQPGVRNLMMLAKVFGVEPGFFYQEAAK